MATEKRVTLLVGGLRVLNHTTGQLRNVYGGLEYHRLKASVFVAMEKQLLAGLAQMTAALNTPEVAGVADEKRVDLFVDDVVVYDPSTGLLRNIFKGHVFPNVKNSVFVEMQKGYLGLLLQMTHDLNG